jgi:hypothetical protein
MVKITNPERNRIFKTQEPIFVTGHRKNTRYEPLYNLDYLHSSYTKCKRKQKTFIIKIKTS